MTSHKILAGAAIAFGIAAAAAGEPARSGARIDLNAIAADVENEADHVDAITLAESIRGQRPGLRVIDLRSTAEFDELSIPTAEHMSVAEAAALEVPRATPIVLYSEGGTHAAQVWFMLRARGYTDVRFLREGMYEWAARVMSPMLPVDPTPAELAEYNRVADLSRYFGGVPRRDMPRDALAPGYWRTEANGASSHQAVDAVKNVRRRGC